MCRNVAHAIFWGRWGCQLCVAFSCAWVDSPGRAEKSPLRPWAVGVDSCVVFPGRPYRYHRPRGNIIHAILGHRGCYVPVVRAMLGSAISGAQKYRTRGLWLLGLLVECCFRGLLGQAIPAVQGYRPCDLELAGLLVARRFCYARVGNAGRAARPVQKHRPCDLGPSRLLVACWLLPSRVRQARPCRSVVPAVLGVMRGCFANTFWLRPWSWELGVGARR